MASEASTADAQQDLHRRVEELERALAEARDRETATSDVLKVISRSTFDLKNVLKTLVNSAANLCQAESVQIFLRDGKVYRLEADNGFSPEYQEYVRHNPIAPGRGTLVARTALEVATVHIPDVLADPEYTWREGQRLGRFRAMLGVPLLRDGSCIGVMAMTRSMPQPFTNNQIELITTFANQAVIAIENTRLFEAEQASKRELQESLEYQTAISEVLSVMSRSPNQLQPVFDAIVHSASRLCGDQHAILTRYDGKLLHLVAQANPRPGTTEAQIQLYPRVPSREAGVSSRAFFDATVVHVSDVEAEAFEPSAKELYRRMGLRAVIAVPLFHDGRPVGVIGVSRDKPGPFSERQVGLLRMFADQAVIAIENTRLFEAEQASKRELQESLEHQTAISEVLSIISRSPSELQPVMDAIASTAKDLCNAYDAALLQRSGDHLSVVSHRGPLILSGGRPMDRSTVTGRALLEKKTIHVHDYLKAAEEFPLGAELARKHGGRTALAIPLVLKTEAIGCLFIRRIEVRPFSNQEIELLKTFAAQAVIAIENTRLFEEVQARTRDVTEALEYQTAISDVLGVIGRSKFDLQPVLTAIVSTACRLCEAPDASIALRQGDWLEFAAGHGPAWVNNEWIKDEKLPIEPGLVAGRAILERRPIHIRDVTMAAEDFSRSRELAIARGHRTTLAVPLLREEEAIGCLFLRRIEVRPFSGKQVALLETFADQAVIAIENVRLFEEIAQKSRELEIASQHKSQFVANMSHELRTPLAAILGYAELIQEGFYGSLPEKSMAALTRIRSNGNHLLGLINTVLDIAKIESGQFTLNMAEYAIESVVETVRSATESLAQNKKLALKTEVPQSLPIGLGDEQRLTQVLLNLVGNAIKFTDTGEVRVTAKAVKGHFNISVTDTGPGIPEEHQARIFEQFHQVDSSNTKAKGGTGLGLAIAKQIVEMHGGRIWVESTFGKGSTFQIELPTRATR
jgi:signal transduction histidine kinase/putative methionine-R-sulfoxide reductase with GAF domain